MDQALVGKIEDALDDLLLPYEFDLSILHRIAHPDLLDHIQRVGIPFYERPPVNTPTSTEAPGIREG